MVTLKGEIELNSQDLINDTKLLMELPNRIRSIEKKLQKLDEDIIILKEFIRSLGAEFRKDGRFP